MSEEAESAPGGETPKSADGAAGAHGAESPENSAESRISGARSDPLAEARATPDAIAASNAYQSFQRSVSAAGSVGVIGTTTVSGGMHFYASGPTPVAQTAGPVRIDLLAAITSWYAPSPGDADLRSMLSDRRLLVLRGVRGSGRSTTALKLLAEFAPGRVHRLATRSNLGEDVCAQVEREHGYLGDLRAADQAPTEAELDRFATRLVEQGAYCILVLSADIDGRSAGVYLRDHVAPQRGTVLERRVEAIGTQAAHFDSESQRTATTLSKDPELWSLLGAEPCPADEVWLAELIERLAAGKIDRMTALASGVELVDRQIGEWLADLPQGVDPYRRRVETGEFAFRLALAVLNGSPADLVAEAGERLAWELYTTANPRLTPGRAVFTRIDDSRLAGSRASVRDGSVNVGDASVPARLLGYRDDRFPVRLLAQVWASRPNLRRPILRWLQDLSQDRRPDVWMRAALAIGLVTSWDFAYSYHEAIESWATSDNLKQRLVAATALDQAARSPSTRAAVGSLLKSWARGDDEARKWTAAAVYSYGDGASDVATLMRLLRRIGVWEGGELAVFTSLCVSDLFTHGPFDEVLAAVDSWIGDTRADEHIFGLLSVLRLGDLRVRHVPNLGDLPLGEEAKAALADPCRSSWPLLVAVAQYSRSHGRLLMECVWQTLSSALTANAMRDEIGDWIRAAGSSPGLLIPLGGFLRGLIDDEDDEARLLDLVDMLVADPDEPIPPSTAYAVRAAIEQSQTQLNQIAPVGR